MLEAGIVDPKVTRSALQNAASVAALLLTTEAVVADKPEPAAPAAPAMDPSMGMGGMMQALRTPLLRVLFMRSKILQHRKRQKTFLLSILSTKELVHCLNKRRKDW